MVKKKFNISNRSTYTLLSIAILILFATVVYAYNTNTPSFFGHSAGELTGVCLSDGTNCPTAQSLDTTCATSGTCSQVCIGSVCESSWPAGIGGSSAWASSTGGKIDWDGDAFEWALSTWYQYDTNTEDPVCTTNHFGNTRYRVKTSTNLEWYTWERNVCGWDGVWGDITSTENLAYSPTKLSPILASSSIASANVGIGIDSPYEALTVQGLVLSANGNLGNGVVYCKAGIIDEADARFKCNAPRVIYIDLQGESNIGYVYNELESSRAVCVALGSEYVSHTRAEVSGVAQTASNVIQWSSSNMYWMNPSGDDEILAYVRCDTPDMY